MFLQSTYGDGDPDGSADFCRWLRKPLTDGRMPDMLENMHFCTFGLGNRSYEHFNAAAKQVDKALTSLGGKKMMKITLGDDDKSLEEDFEEFAGAVEAVREDVPIEKRKERKAISTWKSIRTWLEKEKTRRK